MGWVQDVANSSDAGISRQKIKNVSRSGMLVCLYRRFRTQILCVKL